MKCEKCPESLDHMDEMANSGKFPDTRFVAICCSDDVVAAQENLEIRYSARWSKLTHYYFKDHLDKEQAKLSLGFTTVPFYVKYNENAELTYKGSHCPMDD
jgi:hypothetical protein